MIHGTRSEAAPERGAANATNNMTKKRFQLFRVLMSIRKTCRFMPDKAATINKNSNPIAPHRKKSDCTTGSLNPI